MQRNAITHQRGFSLYEMLVTVSIVAVLAGLAIPSFERLAKRTELNGEFNALLTAINRARALAVETAGRVVLCPATEDGTACRNEPHWHLGWIMFQDDNHDRERNPDEIIFERTPPLAGGNRITSSEYRRRIGYMPTGTAFGSNVTIRFCPKDPQTGARAIIISNAGRPRTQELPDSACSDAGTG